MANRPGTCDLCGEPLPGNPVTGQFGEEQKLFCCRGCARVYEVALDTGMLDTILQRGGAAKKAEPKISKPVFQSRETALFEVEGMWCAGCATAAERVLRAQPGVVEADISFASERGRISYDPALLKPKELLNILSPLGYRARLDTQQVDRKGERAQTRLDLQLTASLAFGMEIMVLYLVQLYPMYAAGDFTSITVRRIQFVVWAMATPVVFYGGNTFIVGAWRALRARTVGMDTLVALGVLVAYSYSAYMTLTGKGQTYFDSVGMIVGFILIGRYLESIGSARARKDVRSLLQLQPEKGWRWQNERWTQVPASELLTGDKILVKPGEFVPADGEVAEGEASVNESMLTGESLPVVKQLGARFFAGTLVNDGALIGTVTGVSQNTRLAQIAKFMTETLSQKPPIQRLADRASTIFTFILLGIAAATFVGWYLATRDLSKALLTSVAVLVVACPCALGLATPLSLTVAMGKSARRGVLVRSPQALETSPEVTWMVFDKTGTLTQGQFVVTDLVPEPVAKIEPYDLLREAAAVEQFSEHPLAKAILRAYPGKLPPAKEFVSLPGMGASAWVEGDHSGERVSAGSQRLAGANPSQALQSGAEQHASDGKTIVWVTRGDQTLGYIALRDRLNRTARTAVQMLHDEGIEAALLSGDSPAASQAVAHEAGIEVYTGGCSPEEKTNRIAEWKAEGKVVGMVGDGVNDAPALAYASLSITAAGGTDIAGQASDLVLSRSDLTLIPWFLQLARRTRRTILQNLGWAFGYNLVAVPLAALGLINPAIAAVAMATSSLLVVANSLRLRRDSDDLE